MSSTGESTDHLAGWDATGNREKMGLALFAGSPLPAWQDWVKRITARKAPVGLRKLLPMRTDAALLWACGQLEPETTDGIRRLCALRRKRRDDEPFDWNQVAKQWLDEIKQRPWSIEFALECLAWSHALPRLVTRLGEENWWALLHAMLAIGDEAADQPPQDNSLVDQLLAGELCVTLAYMFPEVAACVAAGDTACKTLSRGMVDLLDGEGMAHARHLSVMRPLLACWTRSMYLSRATKNCRLTKPARLQFDWLIRQVLRWTRGDRSQVLGPVGTVAGFDDMLQSALDLTDDQSDVALWKLHGGDKQTLREKDLPKPAEHSEWSEVALLRSHWSCKSSMLAVTYHNRSLATELSSQGRLIWSGDSLPQITRNNQPLLPASDWEEVCWEVDHDMDYVELQMELAGSWRIQRQMMLAREDGFAFIADAVLGDTIASIGYRQTLPLAPGVSIKNCDETREAHLMDSKRQGTVVPLALSEWRTDAREGELHDEPAALVQQRKGCALYAPLFVDLDPNRKRKALTWRQLTVAEHLRIVPDDAAVAYRIQIGKQQWVFYRSFTVEGNRTFLGLNFTSEFVAARFETSGESETLIDIAG